MKFGVIGEPCIDFIHRGEKKYKSPGGILYSIVSLASIAPRDEIYPIMNLGSDEYVDFCSFLDKFKNIKKDYIFEVDHKTRVVNLYYKNNAVEYICPDTKLINPPLVDYDREENSTPPTFPIDFNSIRSSLQILDALLVNMVSGMDINIETLKKIRKTFRGYIHLDLHNVVMRTGEDGKRTRGAVENWIEWCTNSDTLQMNELELNIITPEKLKEYEFAESILSADDSGTRALIITRGKKGATLYRKLEKKIIRLSRSEKYFELDKIDIQGVESNKFADSTGCGDVFASGFFYRNSFNAQKDYTAALNYANKLAALKSQLMGVEELYKLAK